MSDYGFPFHSIEELYRFGADQPFPLPAPGDAAALSAPVRGAGFTLPNALAIQPMEGCDADERGAPTELTYRRYRRYGGSGAGLIWAEAIAVSADSRANPRQLMITPDNVAAFSDLIGQTRAAARDAGFPAPVIIAQLTHSGRFSKPGGQLAPLRGCANATMDAHQRIEGDRGILTDEQLDALPERFAAATALCREAGFDGVDVKACHLYLLSELLGAFDRAGRYGGEFDNRVRLLLDCADAASAQLRGGVLAARVNLYDGSAARWGAAEDLSLSLDEPLRLVAALAGRGVSLINVTMGTPYFNPHVNRPYARGGYQPPEHPLAGVGRLLSGCARAQRAAPDAVCVATGFSYLRHLAPAVAAGLVASGGCRSVGFGRQALAYPDFAADILEKGAMAERKSCLTCGLCTVIMRAGGRVGCPVRDSALYAGELRRAQGGRA
ncbi:MAG: flavin oxidoreductase/NADH oxidase [Clostridiales bacterium]|nr:flavin oxidoreductase/NADH oxidase [Clostridiales bacterium]